MYCGSIQNDFPRLLRTSLMFFIEPHAGQESENFITHSSYWTMTFGRTWYNYHTRARAYVTGRCLDVTKREHNST